MGAGQQQQQHTAAASSPEFALLAERPAYDGWRTVVHRDIRLPSGTVATFDVMRQDDKSVLVFPWFTKLRTTTLIKELAPGDMVFRSGVVAGICESHKHASPLQAAAYELEEEAHLIGGRWISLINKPLGDSSDEQVQTPNGSSSSNSRPTAAAAGAVGTVSVDKYSTSHSYVYLVIDPEPALAPRALDPEEFIEIQEGVTAAEVKRRVFAGEMNVMSSFTCLLALAKLEELKLL